MGNLGSKKNPPQPPEPKPYQLAPTSVPKFVSTDTRLHQLVPTSAPKFVSTDSRLYQLAPTSTPKFVSNDSRLYQLAPASAPKFVSTDSRLHQLIPASLPKFVSTESRLNQLTPASVPKVDARTAHDIWETSLSNKQIELDALKSFNSRITTNAASYRDSNEYRAHTIRLERIKRTSELFSGRQTTKPSFSINSFLNIGDKLENIRRYDLKFFPLKGKLPELTPEMLQDIELASKPYPNLSDVLVELDGVQILRKDIQTLLGMNWLNDEVVNAYMNLLVIRGNKTGYKRVYAFNTFFYPKLRESGYSSIKRWTRRVDIFNHDFVLVPVHLGSHWCLALIDFSRRMISYYDSLGGGPQGCCDILLDYLREESNDKRKQELDDENWQLIDRYSEGGIPQQKNCSDCGVFACMYAEYLTRNAKLDFSQEHMPYFRKKMIYELIKKTILE